MPKHKLFHILLLSVTLLRVHVNTHKESTRVHIRKTRSLASPYHLEVNALGKTHKLRLKRMTVEESETFTPNFQMQDGQVDSKTGDVTLTDITPPSDFTNSLSQNVYADPNEPGSQLRIQRNSDGELQATGFLSEDRTIIPDGDTGNHTIVQHNPDSTRIEVNELIITNREELQLARILEFLGRKPIGRPASRILSN